MPRNADVANVSTPSRLKPLLRDCAGSVGAGLARDKPSAVAGIPRYRSSRASSAPTGLWPFWESLTPHLCLGGCDPGGAMHGIETDLHL